jgi:thiamine-monophosphate kinase
MNIKNIGEFGLIARMAPLFSKDLPGDITGIGDDCAVIPREEGDSQLVTTDLLIENTHFLTEKISPDDLGFKALAVNLSDIAAMGGRPFGAFLSLGIPERTTVDWLDRFFSGFYGLASEESVYLLGGDTTSAPDHLVINVAVLGNVHPAKCKRRRGAGVGDLICLTGSVGESAGGLRILLDNLPRSDRAEILIQRHHRPRPHMAEGAWLSEFSAVHAMIDLSDGIHSDIQRIMERSHCGAEIHLDWLPLSRALREAASQFGWDAASVGASGGEDYVLLCTIDPDEYDRLAGAFAKQFGKPLSRIGSILPHESGIRFYSAGRRVKKEFKGFEHFPS